MDKYILCLANSYKHDNRCLAGIELSKTNRGYSVKKDDWGHPIWFRPINRYTNMGAIPNNEAEHISLFDVVKVEDVLSCPDGAQQENHYYSAIYVVDSMEISMDLLDDISRTNRRVIFGNPKASIHRDYYRNGLDYSIIMIKASDVKCYHKEREGKQSQPRMKFNYKNSTYDFPVTDPDFRNLMDLDLEDANKAEHYYLTLSLGTLYEGMHFKLVAAVIHKGRKSTSKKTQELEIVSDSANTTYKMFKEGYTIEQIACKRNMSASTISTHLVAFVRENKINISQLAAFDEIRRVIQYKRLHPDETKLKPYYDAFNGEISYDTIKLILASL